MVLASSSMRFFSSVVRGFLSKKRGINVLDAFPDDDDDDVAGFVAAAPRGKNETGSSSSSSSSSSLSSAFWETDLVGLAADLTFLGMKLGLAVDDFAPPVAVPGDDEATGAFLGAGKRSNKPVPALSPEASLAFFLNSDSSSSESESGSRVGIVLYFPPLGFGCDGADFVDGGNDNGLEEVEVDPDFGGGSMLDNEDDGLDPGVDVVLMAEVGTGVVMDSVPESSESDPYAANASMLDYLFVESVESV